MDKAEKVFNKLAQNFVGLRTSADKVTPERSKKLKQRGYKEVSEDDYYSRKKKLREKGIAKGRKNLESAKDKGRLISTLGLGGLGTTLGVALSKGPKSMAIAGGLGAAAGSGLGYLAGNRSKRKSMERFDKRIDKIKRIDALKEDAVRTSGKDIKFFTKDI